MIGKFTQYHFEGQKNDEEIFLVLHRHWFDIFSQFLILFVMGSLFFGSYIFSFFYFDSFFSGYDLEMAFSFIRSLFLIFIWFTFFLIWIDYYLDVWIITNKRVINIEQKGLFSRIVSELELDNIQDITTDVKGIIPTFLNYGNMHVQTAAETERFIFRNIPDPYKAKNMIMSLQKKSERQEEHAFGELIRKKVHKKNIF